MGCPSCGEEAPPDAKWCEACGQDLHTEPLPACVSCGEREVAEEGYCLSCGHKQPAERDHMEFRDGPAVAVTDRGRRHRHNEDAVAIAATPDGGSILVVCDGVSTTAGSAEASLRAAVVARDLLVAGLTEHRFPDKPDPSPEVAATGLDGSTGSAVEAGVVTPPDGTPPDGTPPDGTPPDGTPPDGTPTADNPGPTAAADPDPASAGDPALDRNSLLRRAVAAAQEEASSTGVHEPDDGDDGGPPSSTFVAVIVRPSADGAELATAWVGDSRAYWVGDEPRRLSEADHEIEGSLVRWLGADSVDPTPDIAVTTVSGSGHVVVCSDGLWRYAEEPGELDELVRRLMSDGHRGLDLASAMVDFANEGGGHDNISVALWERVDSPTPTPTPNPTPTPVQDPSRRHAR